MGTDCVVVKITELLELVTVSVGAGEVVVTLEASVTLADTLASPGPVVVIVLEGTVSAISVVLRGTVVLTLVKVVELVTVAGAMSEILNSHGGISALLKPQRTWMLMPRGLHG